MDDKESIRVTTQGWEYIFEQGTVLSLLPIEDWLLTFEKATAQAPADLDFEHDYIYKVKGALIQDVLRAALVFKNSILEAQRKVNADPRLLGQ